MTQITSLCKMTLDLMEAVLTLVCLKGLACTKHLNETKLIFHVLSHCSIVSSLFIISWRWCICYKNLVDETIFTQEFTQQLRVYNILLLQQQHLFQHTQCLIIHSFPRASIFEMIVMHSNESFTVYIDKLVLPNSRQIVSK